MTVVKIKDGDGNQVFLQATGTGTSSDPLRMLNADNLSQRIQGNIPGETTVFITGNNPNIGTSFVEINDHGAADDGPAVAEALELISDSTDDAAAGTGVQTVLVTTLDANFAEQQQPVTMNGTNAAAVPGTHIARRSIVALTAGSTLSNVGTITLRTVIGSTTRLQIQPTWGTSFSGRFTVPLGKIFIPTGLSFFIEKGQDVIMRPRTIVPGTDGAHVSSGPAPLYQNTSLTMILATNFIDEKGVVFFQGKSSNPAGANGTVVLEGNLIDK